MYTQIHRSAGWRRDDRYMDVDTDFSLKLESLSQCVPTVHVVLVLGGIWGKCYNGIQEICALEGTLLCYNKTTDIAAVNVTAI